MKMTALWLVLFTGFAPLAETTAVESVAEVESQPGMYSVGVAAIDITPAYPIRLNGFGGRRKESEGVRQPIWGKALAVGTTNMDTVIVITVDTLGIPDVLHGRVAEKLKPHGIDSNRLAICASHTHSGPMIQDCANTLFGQPIPDDHWQTILKYTDELETKLVDVAIAALADSKPARLSWGIGKVGFAFNRRTPGGPVDHDLPLLAVHEPDGQLRAVFTNYACHCVTLSDDFISGDWAGYAMEQIQRRNPGCHAMISIGCGADSNPRGGVVGMKFDVADALGNELAEEVQRLLSTELRPLTKAPLSLLERVTLKLATLPTREQWEERAKNQNPTGHHARTQLARLDRGEALMTEVSYPVQTISFGDELAWVFLPGEVVVDYALRLKQELDGSRIWMNAYSNACPGYVPSERILREGGYEGGSAMIYYDIPVPYASGLEETIVGAVQKQLQHNFKPVVDAATTDGIRPLLPLEALSSLRVKSGFRAELVAAEPLIESPVAIAFGPDGKLWVAEMCDYPQGDSSDGGRIKYLVDDDGDGRYDRSEIFLTGLPFPTGVTVWRNGVLICAAPDILFAEDTNGDGKADRVEKLFTGFATHNYQARVNSLEYGLDGWVYGSCGLFGGTITIVKTGETIALGQRDFRFHPDTGILEPATGSTQQGRVRNDWDDWFGCNNSAMLMHYPLADHYLRHNPYLAPSSTVQGITAAPGRLFSISKQVLFMLSGPPNRPTAACGLGVYRDDLLGKEYHGNAFTCEPVNNLVHRQILSDNGVTFTSRRSEDEQDREFLASIDPWFRPVQVRTGPDGALWVVDMYRYVIEHPIWIPPDTLATLDPRAGSTMGRIYRVVPEAPAVRKVIQIDQLQGEQLAAAMDTANGIQRDLVQQRIQWNNDTAAIPTLMQLATESAHPEVRIQALSTWATLESPTVDVLLTSLTDADPHVRRHAVRLCESQLKTSPQLIAAVIDRATDNDAFVRMQVAYSGAFLEPADSAAALAAIIQRDDGDQYLQSAAESAFAADNIGLVINGLKNSSKDGTVMDRLVISAATLADAPQLTSILTELSAAASETAKSDKPMPEHISRLANFINAWSRRATHAIAPGSDSMRAIWKPAMDAAVSIVATEDAAPALRLAAVAIVAQGSFLGDSHVGSLAALLTPRTPPELQSAALAALAKDDRDEIAEIILSDWSAREPRLRKQAVAMLLSRESWTPRLLSAITDRSISVGELDLSQQQMLLDHPNETIRLAAALCFKPRTSASRQQVIDRYVGAFHNDGDSIKGRALFQKHCSNCHRVQDLGHVVGPDIAGYGSKPMQSLLIAMLDPNQAVDPRYQSYVVVLNDGRIVTGLIAEETASSLTLLAPEGKRESVLRSEVEEIRSSGKSLMPEGFEQNASTTDVSDLWAFFKTIRTPPKKLDGNNPTTIQVPLEGNVALLASQAEIYGGDITFELPFRNIGYWHQRDDLVRWRIQSPTIRDVQIWAEWACDPGSAGNTFQIEGGQPALKGKVGSTGGWNRYQLVRIGKLTIPEGESEITMRPAGDLASALVDLRALHLVAPGGVPLATGMVEKSRDETKPGGMQFNSAADIAAFLIDDKNPDGDRERIINAHLDTGGEIISLMTHGLPEDPGSSEEYRRIPWIWRVAIAVGKHGDTDQIRGVLAASVPQEDRRLEHWQAVVIGGGLINGISLSGKWPLEELAAIIGDDTRLRSGWQHTLKQAATMADDQSVPTGTRYDALRIVALLDWSTAEPQLMPYLQKGVHDELQMGAISGISDIPNDAVAAHLISGYGEFSKSNQTLARDALLRTNTRCLALLEALEDKHILPELRHDERVQSLLQHESEIVRMRAMHVLK